MTTFDAFEHAVSCYESTEVTDFLGDMSRLCRTIFRSKHTPQIHEVRKLQALCTQTLRLMEQDEAFRQELRKIHAERTAHEVRDHNADLASEGIRQPEQLSSGAG